MTKKDAQHLKKELQNVLRQYRTMTASMRRSLAALGFTTHMAGRHIKVYFGNDMSRCAVISCTAGDVRSGLNTACDLYKLLVLPTVIA